MAWRDEARSAPRLSKADKCNLFVRRDYRGFRQMIDAHERGLVEHLRWDDAGKDGIHVNYAEYGRVMGFLR